MADISLTPANILYVSGDTGTGIAGEAIVAGKSLYLDASTPPLLKLAKSDGLTPINNFLGIALNNAAIGQPVKYQITGVITLGTAALTVATGAVYLSDTAGGLTQTIGDLETGDTLIFIGIPLSTTQMRMNPTVGATL